MSPDRTLWYFADPMCSWCWGFAPVVDAIKAAYGDRLKIALVLGGLRPGTTEPLAAAMRDEILHHWHEVQARSGQSFDFEGAMPDGFVYDTEPPSRAVVVVGGIRPDDTFQYFKAVQAAFYTQHQDVTRPEVLAALAAPFGVGHADFMARFNSDDAKHRTALHFGQARDAGVRGFPTTVMQNAAGYTLLSHGYRSFEEIKPELEAWLAD